MDDDAPRAFNLYRYKKLISHGLMDVALFSANANQLRYVFESSDGSVVYVTCVVLLLISIFLQVFSCISCSKSNYWLFGNRFSYTVYFLWWSDFSRHSSPVECPVQCDEFWSTENGVQIGKLRHCRYIPHNCRQYFHNGVRGIVSDSANNIHGPLNGIDVYGHLLTRFYNISIGND